VNCQALDRWLDDGGPDAGRAAAVAHARTCERCAAALAHADALELALSATPSAAPAGFTDRVMARVADASQVRVGIPVMEMLPLLRTFPWWVRLALEPATVLAALIASVLVWRGDALFALAGVGAVRLSSWVASSITPLFASVAVPASPGPLATLLLQPTVLTCLVIGSVPLAWMMSQVLFGWSATLVGPRHLGLRPH
jgi:hypothetical protein